AGIDYLFSKRDGGHTAIIEDDQVFDFRFTNGGEHFFGISDIQRERFLAHHMLAGPGRGRRDFGVRDVRRADVNDIDQRRFDQFAPVRGGVLPAELSAGGFNPGAIAAADGVHLDFGFEWKEMGSLAPGVRMSLAHKSVPDHSYA